MDAGRDRRMARIKGVLALDLDSDRASGRPPDDTPSEPRERAFRLRTSARLYDKHGYNPRILALLMYQVSSCEGVLQTASAALHVLSMPRRLFSSSFFFVSLFSRIAILPAIVGTTVLAKGVSIAPEIETFGAPWHLQAV